MFLASSAKPINDKLILNLYFAKAFTTQKFFIDYRQNFIRVFAFVGAIAVIGGLAWCSRAIATHQQYKTPQLEETLRGSKGIMGYWVD